jgi:hypothetical protein
MSNTANQPPTGTPPASQQGADDPPPSQSPPGSKSGGDQPQPSSPPDSKPTNPAQQNAAPDSAPASSPGDSAPPSAQDSKPDGQSTDSAPPSSQSPNSQAPDSKPPDSGGCAEIPTAAHVVLETDVKFIVELPMTMDEAAALPHKFTLTSDDGNVSQTLTLAADGRAGDADGTVILTFTGLAEHHTYTLQCDNSDTIYALFKNVDYDQLHQITPAEAGSPPEGSDPGSDGGGSGEAGAGAPTGGS